MEKNEIKDRLFDVLDDTDNLPIQDIVVDDRNNIVNVYQWYNIFSSCRKMWNLEHL